MAFTTFVRRSFLALLAFAIWEMVMVVQAGVRPFGCGGCSSSSNWCERNTDRPALRKITLRPRALVPPGKRRHLAL